MNVDALAIPEATVYLLEFGGENHFTVLKEETPWRQRSIMMYGRSVPQPRLTAWYGDADRHYSYSGVDHAPLPWTDTLQDIRERLKALLGVEFNSVLLNFYRSGRDAIGFHSDDERELGREPIIASLSYGGHRTFTFRHKMQQHPDVDIELGSGSLLVMMGETQRRWKHGIERCDNAEPRINLTFRQILG